MKRHFRLRKRPFYPLNYGDASESQNEEVRRMKNKNPEIRFSIVDLSLANSPRKTCCGIATQNFLFRPGSESLTLAGWRKIKCNLRRGCADCVGFVI